MGGEIWPGPLIIIHSVEFQSGSISILKRRPEGRREVSWSDTKSRCVGSPSSWSSSSSSSSSWSSLSLSSSSWSSLSSWFASLSRAEDRDAEVREREEASRP